MGSVLPTIPPSLGRHVQPSDSNDSRQSVRELCSTLSEPGIDAPVRSQQNRCDLAVPARPVEQDLLVPVHQVVWSIRFADVLLYAAGWITEEKALDPLRSGGLVYRGLTEAAFIQLNGGRRPAEDRLDNGLAGLDPPPDSAGQQSDLSQRSKPVIVQGFFPSAQGLESFAGEQRQIGQFEVDLPESPKAALEFRRIGTQIAATALLAHLTGPDLPRYPEATAR